MAYVTTTDPLLQFSLYGGLAAFLLTIVLVATIAILRYLGDRRRRRLQALRARWEPVFFHAVEAMPCSLPPLLQGERHLVLRIWIDFTEAIRGDSHIRLRELAFELGLDTVALELLHQHSVDLQLLGIVALGRLHNGSAWSDLERLSTHASPTSSLLAARSLLQIDPRRAARIVLKEAAARKDWPLAKIVSMFREMPPSDIAEPLLEIMRTAGPDELPRLIHLLGSMHVEEDTWPLLEPLLAIHQPVEVIIAALKVCKDPRALNAVRRLTAHQGWAVRARAAATLEHIGDAQDRFRLQAMLSDPEWWVRYRAALTLAHLPFVSRQKLADLITSLNDKFAVDILRQVSAEAAEHTPAP